MTKNYLETSVFISSMSDYGMANGPNDMRSHAEMVGEDPNKIMKKATDSENGVNPFQPCPECGGSFIRNLDRDNFNKDISIPSLVAYVCENCNDDVVTYDWAEEHKKYHPEVQHQKD